MEAGVSVGQRQFHRASWLTFPRYGPVLSLSVICKQVVVYFETEH